MAASFTNDTLFPCSSPPTTTVGSTSSTRQAPETSLDALVTYVRALESECDALQTYLGSMQFARDTLESMGISTTAHLQAENAQKRRLQEVKRDWELAMARWKARLRRIEEEGDR